MIIIALLSFVCLLITTTLVARPAPRARSARPGGARRDASRLHGASTPRRWHVQACSAPVPQVPARPPLPPHPPSGPWPSALPAGAGSPRSGGRSPRAGPAAGPEGTGAYTQLARRGGRGTVSYKKVAKDFNKVGRSAPSTNIMLEVAGPKLEDRR